jgi:WD40 repeat protein
MAAARAHMPKIYRFIGVSSAVCFTGLIVGLLIAIAGTHKVWSDDVIRSATPSAIYLREIARVPIEADGPGGGSIQALAWSPDGKRLAAAFDWGFQVSVFDTSDWRQVSRFKGKSFQPERQLAFLSNSEIITSPSENNTDSPSALAFYDSETGRLSRELPRPPEFSTALTDAIAVPSGGRYIAYIASGMRRSTLLFEAVSGKFIGRLATPIDSVTPTIAGGLGDRLAVSVSFLAERAESEVRKEIYLFDASTNAVDRILAGHVPGVGSLAWSPDGKLIASGASMLTGKGGGVWIRDQDPIRVWNVETGTIVASFFGLYDPIYQLAWHPSKRVLATRSARSASELGSAIRLWSVDHREMIFEFRVPHGGSTSVISFHPQTGHLVSAWGGELRVFEVLGLP